MNKGDFDFGYGLDWNDDGKHDTWDTYLDMECSGDEEKDSYTGGPGSYRSSYKYVYKDKEQPKVSDDDWFMIFKMFLAIIIIFGCVFGSFAIGASGFLSALMVIAGIAIAIAIVVFLK